MHQYWHFVDTPYSAGAPGQPSKTPNALTEIEKLSAAIATDESDDVKSYDVVWLEHLVGDIHQPLHATSRFTMDHPPRRRGRQSGLLSAICRVPTSCTLTGMDSSAIRPRDSRSRKTARLCFATPSRLEPSLLTSKNGSPVALTSPSPLFIAHRSATTTIRPSSFLHVRMHTTRAEANRVANEQIILAGYRPRKSAQYKT